MTFQFDWFGEQVKAATVDDVEQGLAAASEFVLGESLKVVPREEATLAGSGATDVDPIAQRASISYDTPYAARQHEELSWRHRPGQTAKYLERPLLRSRQQVQDILAAYIGRNW